MFDRKDGLPPVSDLMTPAPAPVTPAPPTPPPADTGWRLDKKEWNLLDGDLKHPDDGYFIGGKGEKGVRWGTAGGGFTGSIHQEGLDIEGKPGDFDIHARGDFKKKEGDISLGQGGSQLLDLYGGGSGLSDWHAGVKNDYQLSPGLTLTPSLQHEVQKGKGDEKLSLDLKGQNGMGSLSGTYYDGGGYGLNMGLTQKDGDTTTTRGTNIRFGDQASVGNTFGFSNKTDSVNFAQNQGVSGDSLSLGASHKFDGGSAMNGGFSLSHDAKGAETDKLTLGGSTPFAGGTASGDFGLTLGPGGKTAEDLGLKYASKTDELGLKLHEGGANDRSLNLDARHNFSDDAYLKGNFALNQDAKGSNWKLGESYGSKQFAESMSIGGATDGSSISASGRGMMQLGSNLYAGAYGDVGRDQKGTNWDAGGSLTYMATPNIGITGAGGYGSNGYDARIEADFFKDKVTGAGSLQDARSKPMFDVFLGVQGGGGANLGGQMGGADWSRRLDSGGGPQVTAGVGWKF